MAKILLVDDDPQAQSSTRKILELEGHDVTAASDGEEALAQVRSGTWDLVVSDVRMPKMSGIEFLRALALRGETVPTVLMTAFGQIEEAVWAMKLGAVDFLTKPFKRQALIESVQAALKRAPSKSHKSENAEADSWIGHSPAFLELQRAIDQIAPTLATVLITGESGTGKERVARRLHRLSARAKQAWVAVNCAAIPDSLLESELFGSAKGAYTGATQARQGLFEAAHQGTLFLDEVGEIPLGLQAKLLRVLQEGEIRRLGETLSRKVDVRLITATNRDLKAEVDAGRFREDLYYRLEVLSLRVPPLRDRPEDIQELAYAFMHASARRHAKTVKGITEPALEALLAHAWPGNIRELANAVERAVVLSGTQFVELEDLPAHLRGGRGDAHVPGAPQAVTISIGTPLREVEELLIRKTLQATEGDKNLTARLLGINSRTIYRKLEKPNDPA